MQRVIYFFMIFALSLATDVSVYNDFEQYFKRLDAMPVFESAAPWKFEFTTKERLFLLIYVINRSPCVNHTLVTYESGFNDIRPITLSNGKKANVFVHQLSSPEAIITENLCTSNGLCRPIRIAEGRVVAKKSEKEHKYTDTCFKAITEPCAMVVNLKDVICEDVQHTNDTVIMIGSISGITLIVIAIIILIQTRVLRCCTKHSPQATPDLPTNPHTDPFYLNMLFRRECDQEIAQIDEHEYEEINPQRPERVPEDLHAEESEGKNRGEPGMEPEAVAVSQFPWKLSYDSDDWFWIRIKLINQSPSVTAINITCQTDYGTCVQSVCLLLVDLKHKCDAAEIHTTVIVSSIFGIALILLVTIALWKRCWIKRNPSSTPQLRINEPSDPFYLNMLFRRECDQEIAQIERHPYEEIREHQNEEKQNHYEEINPHEEPVTEHHRVEYTSTSSSAGVSPIAKG